MRMLGRGLWCFSVLLLSVTLGQAKEIKQKKNIDVIVEVKFVEIAQSVVEALKQQGLLGQESKGQDVPSLDSAQMARFLEVIQSDVRTNVLQTPQLTMRNGKTATMNPIDVQHFVTGLEVVYRDGQIEYHPKRETIPLGIRIGLRSVVSADRRSVRVHLDAMLTNLDSSEATRFPITTPAPDGKSATVTHYIEQPRVTKLGVNRKMVIPDGKTAVLTGLTRTCEFRNEFGPPILSDIPLLGRLFCSIGYGRETHHLLVLVTPRILVPQEKEEKTSRKSAAEQQEIRPCHCEEDRDDLRTIVLGAYRDQDPQCSEEPDEARILRAMKPVKRGIPYAYEESRDNIQIVTERIVDKIDPPRCFPLVGRAQLHHCQWKCTVYYTETITSRNPSLCRSSRPQVQVIYIDTDHLHTCSPQEQRGK